MGNVKIDLREIGLKMKVGGTDSGSRSVAVLNLWVLYWDSWLARWILGKQAMRMRDGWNWLRIVSIVTV
jgi:hypothetical protein